MANIGVLKAARSRTFSIPIERNVSLGNEEGGASAGFQLHNLDNQTLNLRPVPTQDPNEPLNWPTWKKLHTMIAAAMSTLFCFTLLCIVVPSWTVMTRELGWTFEQLNNSYAAAMGSIGIGSVLFVPFAVKYGRRGVYLASIALLIVGAAWSARMTHVWELYATQIIMGLATSTSEILIELVISDLFFVHERATMNGMYLIFCYLGNNMSQVAGGYITRSQGWRWSYWYCLIFVSILWLLLFFTFEETKYHAPEWIKNHHRKSYVSVSNEEISSKRPWVDTSIARKPLSKRFALYTKTPTFDDVQGPSIWRGWLAPFVCLWRFPLVMFVAIEYGLSVAWTCIMSTSASQYLGRPPYSFSSAGVGNINIAPFVGTVIGTVLGGWMCDWAVIQLAKLNHGVFEPEMRLYCAILPSLSIAASLFLFGYGFARQLHWAAPVVAYGLASFGGTALSDSLLTYLLDCYRDIIGEALIGVVFVQNALPTALVFALQPWIRGVGIDIVFVICGAFAIAGFLLLFPVIVWGKDIRIRGTDRYNSFKIKFARR